MRCYLCKKQILPTVNPKDTQGVLRGGVWYCSDCYGEMQKCLHKKRMQDPTLPCSLEDILDSL